ncbi:MAG TPA: GAF domain-containing protein [Gaiellaceae bacterium]|nr:GAF domain-containing protein [Gaiellaceae bacterium]
MKTESSQRLRRLVEAGIALSSELSLDALLQHLVEAAASITDARYAALGVINEERSGLERFLTSGVDAGTHARIGELPRGRGILGALITDARALRLHDVADDPRSVGFPPGHPPMRGFLGVPIVIRGVAWGNLYLCEKDGGDFTEEDEELVLLLAGQAAVAIENARLYESATRWSRQLESLTEVGNALSSELDLPRLLQLVTERLRELLDARLVTISLPGPAGTLRVEAADGEDAAELLQLELARDSKSARVLERRRSERVDSVVDDPEVDQGAVRAMRATSALYVPLLARDRAIGVVAVHDRLAPDTRFDDADLRLAETFAARASVAADLSTRVARDAMRRVVAAQELERRRLARELHDETGQALTSILLGLRALEEAPSEEQRQRAAHELRELVVTTLQDVRRLAVELRPQALDDFGLVPALERLVDSVGEQSGIETQLEARLGERLSPEAETALYRIVQEALTNVVKHAEARHVSILLVRREASVSAVIEDDGRGFVPSEAREGGLGLLGMRERLELVDGRFDVESQPGSGTTIVAEVPA